VRHIHRTRAASPEKLAGCVAPGLHSVVTICFCVQAIFLCHGFADTVNLSVCVDNIYNSVSAPMVHIPYVSPTVLMNKIF
jgi:hypothetical protein